MARLAQAKQGNQIQKGAKPFAKGGVIEGSDAESKKYGKEGSKKEEAFDKASGVKPLLKIVIKPKKCGGKVGK